MSINPFYVPWPSEQRLPIAPPDYVRAFCQSLLGYPENPLSSSERYSDCFFTYPSPYAHLHTCQSGKPLPAYQ